MIDKRCMAVFGGSGKTGREVARAAMAKGFGVRALYRPGSEPNEAIPGDEAITVQLTESNDVRRTW